MNVYELTQETIRIQELLDTIEQMESAGEDGLDEFKADTLKTFDEITGHIATKMDNIAMLICNLLSEAAAKKAEIERMKTRIAAIDKKVEYLKNVLMYPAIKAFGLKKIEGDIFTVSTRKSEVVNIFEEGKIPQEYINIKMTQTPDKTAIKKAIKSGVSVPGAEIVENESVQIK